MSDKTDTGLTVVAYLYSDCKPPEAAHPLLHSTLLTFASQRRPTLMGETPLVTLAEASERIRALEAQVEALKRKPLGEGALMGVYIDFDRTASKEWTDAEYLLWFARAIERAHEITGEQA